MRRSSTVFAGQLSLFDQPSEDDPLGTGPCPVEVANAPTTPTAPLRPDAVRPDVVSGTAARIEANLAALRLAVFYQSLGTPVADDEDRSVLARYSGWGGLAQVFVEDDPAYVGVRGDLTALVGMAGYEAARAGVLNAHYSDPEIAEAMWGALCGLGFSGGRVLEAGCGSGTFLGLAPASAEMVGIEIDPSAALVARLVHAGAEVRNEGFEQTRFQGRPFAAVIGNVPFGDVVLCDPLHNPSGLSIHNHFIAKALDFLAPGGVAVVLTSRYTLDAKNPASRRALSARADLLGALRLPAGSHRKRASTDVIMDLLVLRARDSAPDAEPDWVRTVAFEGERDIPFSPWFCDHPEAILGQAAIGRGQYRDHDLVVKAVPGSDLAALVRDGLAAIVESALHAGMGWAPVVPCEAPVVVERSAMPEGSLCVTDDGFGIVTGGSVHPYDGCSKRDTVELGRLIGLRDLVVGLLTAQGDPACLDESFTSLLGPLNTAYDDYAGNHGVLNRVTITEGRGVDPLTDQARQVRRRPSMGGFRSDPRSEMVFALEHYDETTGAASKAPIFTRRVIVPVAPVLGVDDPAEALAVSLAEHGSVVLATIAGLLGVREDEALTALSDRVFTDPAGGELVTREAYLSGDVVAKLEAARTAAENDPSFEANAAALRAVLPARIEAEDISVAPGAAWISDDDLSAFINEVLEVREAMARRVADGSLVVEHAYGRRFNANRSEYGVSGRSDWDGIALLCHAVSGAPVRVTKTVDGVSVEDVEATLVAGEKMAALVERFGVWAFEDDDRRARLVERYNSQFNRYSPRGRYDGSHLRLPGLATTFRPHDYQRDAVWRILSEPSVLVAHPVGAGKTAVMVMAGMEMKRLGMVRLPAYIVPNHMVEQFSREFGQLYPQARVLVPDRSDTTKALRVRLAAQIATDDWDAVVLSHSTFTRLPVSAALREDYLERAVEVARQASVDRYGEGSKKAVRLAERFVAQQRERMKRDLCRRESGQDAGPCWETLGVDYLFYDESAQVKNLGVTSANRELSRESSLRAMDLDMKLGWLRERNPRHVTTFATATPVANTLTEVHTMLHYLAPEVLKTAGVEVMDVWAATFARKHTTVELKPAGGGFRVHTRIARFANVPELMVMLRMVLDLLEEGWSDALANVPNIKGGKPEVVVVPQSDGLGAFIGELGARADALAGGTGTRPDGREDNILVITGEGRRAAVDLRAVGRIQDGAGKLDAVAERVAAIHEEHRDDRFPDVMGTLHLRPGGLQLVFLDISTPKADVWHAYGELRRILTERHGIAREQVAFMHEATDDRAKARLFGACRDGRIAVLIGSTERMGTGVNVQARGVATHHVDCPWRPDHLEQRDGRLARQGCLSSEVAILRYAVSGSFDVYMWQTCERKSAFIGQVMRGDPTVREMADLDDQALSYAEVKALASGNPLVLEKVGIDHEVSRLTRLATAHRKEQQRLESDIAAAKASVALSERRSDAFCELAGKVEAHRGDAFSLDIGGAQYRERAAAGRAVIAAVEAERRFVNAGKVIALGCCAGLDFGVQVIADMVMVARIVLADAPSVGFDLTKDASALGCIAKLEHLIDGLAVRAAEERGRAARLGGEVERMAARFGAPFPYADALAEAKKRQRAVAAELIEAA